jgi:hypothetical protein
MRDSRRDPLELRSANARLIRHVEREKQRLDDGQHYQELALLEMLRLALAEQSVMAERRQKLGESRGKVRVVERIAGDAHFAYLIDALQVHIAGCADELRDVYRVPIPAR